MKKHKLTFSGLVVRSLPFALLVAAFPAGANAADPAPATSAGQLSTLFKIDDGDPEAHVPDAKQRIGNPLEFGYYLQDLLAKAELATKRHDHERAIKYYRALAAAIPEQATAWSKLCDSYEKANDRARAVRACKYALDREGVQLDDYRRYFALMAAKPDDLVREEANEMKAVLEHLDKQPELATPTAHFRCQAAIKMKDAPALRACTEVLAKLAPEDPKTIVFQWSLAVMTGNGDEAARLVERGRKAGLAAESIERMNNVPVDPWWSSRGSGVALLGGVAFLLALMFLISLRRRIAATRRLAP